MTKDSSKNPYYTIAFYNLENLFDTIDNPHTNDEGFLPSSDRKWTPKRYKKKLRKLGYTISRIGTKTAKKPPVIVGLAEVENKRVIKDLVKSKFLKDLDYGIVHYDSPDERGIDVALIFKKQFFQVIQSEVFPLDLTYPDGMPDYTRDILMVKGQLNGETIYVLVNHWPSRREGEKETEPKRMKAAHKVIEIIHQIKVEDKNAKVIIMGDFNDGPNSKSIKHIMNATDVYNPMIDLLSFRRGSLGHHRKWYLFDQILFTTNLFEYESKRHSFSKVNIFDLEFLKQYKGKYKNFPFRTFVGRKYKGGYSDHFPVFLHLRKSD